MEETIPFEPPKSFTIEELQNRLQRLRTMCPLTIKGEDKKRHSAVGETMEIYLGLRNDSNPTSDWGDYEIKTSSTSKSMVSMFTIKWDFAAGYNLSKLAFDYGKEHFSKHLQMPCIRLDRAIPHLSEPQPRLHFKVDKSKNLVVLKYDDNDIGVIEMMNLRSKFLNKFKTRGRAKLSG